MDMWSKEFIKKEMNKIPNNVREEIKRKFENSNREDFKPPEDIELILTFDKKKDEIFDSFDRKKDVAFDKHYKSQPKVGYAVNFGTQKTLNEGFISAA